MKLFNFHTHSAYCDGSDQPEAYVKEAIRQGFYALGFSSHSPLPFSNSFAVQSEAILLAYAEEIRRLKMIYASQINIYLGLEIDFIPEVSKPFDFFREFAGLDYAIGGVHLIKKQGTEALWFIDGPRQESYDEGMKLLYGDDVQSAVTAYWKQIREMLLTQKPDVVAHLDKIKMHNHNRFFREDEKWYENQLGETLELIAETGVIVEVNTRGIYKGRSEELFPGTQALKKIHHMGIPITLSADAHRPEELSGYFPQTLQLLKSIGFTELMMFTGENWQPEKLD
ncbi:MAG TPA: histidinol-phosphatase [Bacteroidales bacterium]|nr:histidinol-phosphatase [Bacteroidales bacterium]